MAYEVDFSVPERPLERADIRFVVRENGVTFGTLEVSKGSVVWFPANVQYGHKAVWDQFDRIMQNHATRFEKR